MAISKAATPTEITAATPSATGAISASAPSESGIRSCASSAKAVVFTAHSVPERAVAAGDPYVHEVTTTARAVAAHAGITRWHQALQSAGRTPEPWVGPDLGECLRHRVAEGARRFLVVPIGFVCDHTEILFDIDVQAAGIAAAMGATLRRTASLNSSPTFTALLEALVRDRL